MRVLVLAGLLLFSGAYLFGHWWFDKRNQQHLEARRIMESRILRTAPPRVLAPARTSLPRRPLVDPVRLQKTHPRATDDLLEEMMLDHRDAMLMLREAIHHQLLYRGSPISDCREHVTNETVCWIRFQCTLHGQLMELKVGDIDCGARGQPARPTGDAVLQACIRERLTIGDSIGVPLEAAEELGEYTGPVDVPLSWTPK